MTIMNLMKYFVKHPVVTEDALKNSRDFRIHDLHTLEKARFVVRTCRGIELNKGAIPMVELMIKSYERSLLIERTKLRK